MASTEELEAILREIESSAEVQALDDKHKNTKKTNIEPPTLLSVEHVLATVNVLTECPIIKDQVKSCFKTVPVEKLKHSLEWLNLCLVNKRLMTSAAIDKVWRAYQSGLQEHLSEMAKVTSSKQASALLALHVMKALVKVNYRQPKGAPAPNSTTTERDIEILTYITGFLLRRYRHLPEAQALRTTEATGFTAAIDRGGLMKPKSECVRIVIEMEEVFRSLPTKSVDKADFQKILCEQDVPRKLFELLGEVESSTENKEQFYIKISDLYFTVRAHQKCRQLLEQHLKKTRSVRKSKALRDSI